MQLMQHKLTTHTKVEQYTAPWFLLELEQMVYIFSKATVRAARNRVVIEERY